MSEDTISRQAAIEVIDAVMPVDPNKSEYASGIACGAALAMTYVKQLPSADRPQGEWIDTTSGEHWKCSSCGCRASFFLYDGNKAVEWLSEYCPNCGARMKGADDE